MKAEGRILRMQELKRQVNQTIDESQFMYKSTIVKAKRLAKKYGFVEIKKTFIKDNIIFKASITVYKSSGRTYESFDYLPMYSLVKL